MESRLQGLLQYLHLLNEVDNGSLPFSLFEQKKRVCKEIEKELWIGELEQQASVDVEGDNEGTSDFIQVIVNMQNKIELLETKIKELESNKDATKSETVVVNVDYKNLRSADEIVREISKYFIKSGNSISL